jgi:hypothetical protein
MIHDTVARASPTAAAGIALRERHRLAATIGERPVGACCLVKHMDRGMLEAIAIGLSCCLLGALMLLHRYPVLGWIPLALGSAVVASVIALMVASRRR